MRHEWIYFVIGGFAGGVLLRSFVLVPIAFVAFLFVLGLALLFFLLIRGKTKYAIGIPLLCFSIALGILRFEGASVEGNLLLENSVGAQIAFEGVVLDEPDSRETNTKYTVRPEVIVSDMRMEIDGGGYILVTADKYPQLSYGDRIEVRGRLDRPKNFEGDTGRIFNYVEWLKKDGIVYTIAYPDITKTSEGGGNPIKRTLFAVKKTFLGNIEKMISEPQSALLGGLVVGAKQSLGAELLDAFRAVGVIHIVVLSGYNMTIVASFVGKLFAFLGKRAGIYIGIGMIALFTIMTGGAATAVRAALMASLVLVSQLLNRPYVMFRALLVAGFFMVLWNPRSLAFDPSFQLSFLATLSLILLAPKVEKYLLFITDRWQLREVATATLSTQIFVLPFLLWMTGEFSLVSLPANILILATIPATMFVGFLAGLVGFVSSALAFPFVVIANGLLSYQLWVVNTLASFPFASVILPAFPFWVVGIIYGSAGLAVLYRAYVKKYKKGVVATTT
jgi:competence protein ComEC